MLILYFFVASMLLSVFKDDNDDDDDGFKHEKMMTKLKSMKFETEHIHFSLFSSSVFGAPVSPFNYVLLFLLYYYSYYSCAMLVASVC